MLFRSLLITIALYILPHHCAQAAEDTLPLKIDRTFQALTASNEPTAAFISAESIVSASNGQLEASGDVQLRREGQTISAEHLIYQQNSKDVLANGNVTLIQGGTQIQGPLLNMNMESNIGDLSNPAFLFEGSNAHGNAASLHFGGNQNYSFDSASYTTCPIGNDDWLLKMGRLELDRNKQVGVAHNAWIEFKGVPLLYTPWMDFALNDSNRSGFLGPVFGSTNSGGTEVTVPYYWNIAPNFDATFSPRFISKRGTQFNNEFRYLAQNFQGKLDLDLLPNDKVSQLDRRRVALTHKQSLGEGFAAAANFNYASDNAYFRDLSDNILGTSQTNLVREGVITYRAGNWNAAARMQSFQTLQDPSAPVVAPYWRQPQINVNGSTTFAESNLTFNSEFIDFRHASLISGRRIVINPTISYPLLNDPGYFVTPKLGIHHTNYLLDTNNNGYPIHSVRTLPTFSLDSGLIMERSDSFLGTGYMQTLEPRAYYVHIPYVDQSLLPNFDTAQAPFSFSQMFTENRFLGSDRIGDADMLTMALTSRAIDDDEGTERLRIGIAERFSFKTPKVNLTQVADPYGRSDILMTLGGKMTRAWRLDSLLQYNPNQSRLESYSAAARYNPEAGKLLNLGYRYTRDTLRQVDVSTQWPISGRWHGVGRFNFSLQDKLILEALAGLEYNQDCWTVRLVSQSFATATQKRATGTFIQLELNDMVRIGSDPLAALRASVSGYTKLNDSPSVKPSKGLR
ncbi:MAG: LPS-assembly protein LptD [Sideroxydans sp.]|nr:LPS-assembly protein LptD [Sideroxydans sp.]